MPADIGRDHIRFGSVYVRAPSAVPQIADLDGMVPDCRVGPEEEVLAITLLAITCEERTRFPVENAAMPARPQAKRDCRFQV